MIKYDINKNTHIYDAKKIELIIDRFSNDKTLVNF